MNEREALKLTLAALKQIDEAMPFPVAKLAIMEAEKALAQPQRKPLTDEEIILIVAECAASHQHTDIHFARAIERAHGIKGEA